MPSGETPFGLGVEVGDDAVPQHGGGHCPNIFGIGEGPPVQHGPRLGPRTRYWLARGPAPH